MKSFMINCITKCRFEIICFQLYFHCLILRLYLPISRARTSSLFLTHSLSYSIHFIYDPYVCIYSFLVVINNFFLISLLNLNWRLHALYYQMYNFHGCFEHNLFHLYGYSIVSRHFFAFQQHNSEYVLYPISGPYRVMNDKISSFCSSLLSMIN